MRLADAHIHLFQQGYHDRYQAVWSRRDEVELYECLRAEHGIERALVVGYEGADRFAGNNAYVVREAETRDWIAPVAFLSPSAPPSMKELRRWMSEGFIGLSVYLDQPEDLADLQAWPVDLLRTVDETCKVVSINAPPDATSGLAAIVPNIAGSQVLISHLGLPGEHRDPPPLDTAKARMKGLLELSRFESVGVKVSGLYAVSDPSHGYPHRAAEPFLEVLYEAFGPHRLFWGSDFSPCLEHVSFAQAVDVLGLVEWSREEKSAVMGGNLIRILSGAH